MDDENSMQALHCGGMLNIPADIRGSQTCVNCLENMRIRHPQNRYK